MASSVLGAGYVPNPITTNGWIEASNIISGIAGSTQGPGGSATNAIPLNHGSGTNTTLYAATIVSGDLGGGTNVNGAAIQASTIAFPSIADTLKAILITNGQNSVTVGSFFATSGIQTRSIVGNQIFGQTFSFTSGTASGTITAGHFVGDGSGLTGTSAANAITNNQSTAVTLSNNLTVVGSSAHTGPTLLNATPGNLLLYNPSINTTQRVALTTQTLPDGYQSPAFIFGTNILQAQAIIGNLGNWWIDNNGNVVATSFAGDGSQLTGITPVGALTNNQSTAVTISNNFTVDSSHQFIGKGTGLTGIPPTGIANDGNVNHFLNGTGVFSTPPGGGSGSFPPTNDVNMGTWSLTNANFVIQTNGLAKASMTVLNYTNPAGLPIFQVTNAGVSIVGSARTEVTGGMDVDDLFAVTFAANTFSANIITANAHFSGSGSGLTGIPITGLVGDGNTSHYLRGDLTWSTIPAAGAQITGSPTANQVATFANSTTIQGVNTIAQSEYPAALTNNDSRAITVSNNFTVDGAHQYNGSGSGLTGIPGSSITGTVPQPAYPAALTNNQSTATTISNNLTVDSAHGFYGNGANLTALSAGNLTGTSPQSTYPAALTNNEFPATTFFGALYASNSMTVSNGLVVATGGHLTVEGTTSTGATGTGGIVFSNSPTITTPTIVGGGTNSFLTPTNYFSGDVGIAGVLYGNAGGLTNLAVYAGNNAPSGITPANKAGVYYDYVHKAVYFWNPSNNSWE